MGMQGASQEDEARENPGMRLKARYRSKSAIESTEANAVIAVGKDGLPAAGQAQQAE